jgi:protein-S-isoprenylcysteine O-methyltransferase Ste14
MPDVVSIPVLVDALLAAAWIWLAIDSLRVGRSARREPPSVPAPARLGLLALLLAGVAALESRTGGRIAFQPLAAGAGVALAWAGVVLHARARRALGALWSSAVGVPPGHPVVTHGPYARVRHPLYAGVLLLALGSVLAHPSAATACLAIGFAAGMALKIPAEERALRAACGDAWTRYADEVPALIPRPRVAVTRARRASRSSGRTPGSA